jgi:hypothetical protein
MECHQGVPLAIPKAVFDEAGVNWGDQVFIDGSVRFLQDVVYVDKITGAKPKKKLGPIIITPVALFESVESDEHRYDRAQYTFGNVRLGKIRCLTQPGSGSGNTRRSFPAGSSRILMSSAPY